MQGAAPFHNLNLFDAMARMGGIREYRGGRDNPEIVEMFKSAGASWIQDDEHAWCSACMCTAAHRAGLYNPRTVRARAWPDRVPEEHADRIAEVDNLVLGDVVILSRGRGGHVGLFMHRDGDKVHLLGGNQGNKVQPRSYYADRFLIGLRLK